MRKMLLCAMVAMFSVGLLAQEHYTEGPVWQVTLVRVKPENVDAYLSMLRQNNKPILEEAKKEGLIMDYKIFSKASKSNPNDWDYAIAIEMKNWAALDGLSGKFEAISNKVLGGKQQGQQLLEKRAVIREIVSEDIMQEIMLK